MNDLPRRQMSRPVWHQTRPGNVLLQFEDPATYDGRYHRAGGPGAWYASLTERGAWAELFRHWGQHELSPFEVRLKGQVGWRWWGLVWSGSVSSTQGE